MVIMTILDILFAATAIFGGWFLRYCVSDEPNEGVGFRTKAAMANPAAWRYANYTCGRLWLTFGGIGLALIAVNVYAGGFWGAVGILVLLVIGVTGSAGWVNLQLAKHED